MKSWNQPTSKITTQAKKKNTRKLEKAEEVGPRIGWLQLQDLILPPRFYMPITQAAKETQLEPDTVEGKVQGVRS